MQIDILLIVTLLLLFFNLLKECDALQLHTYLTNIVKIG